MALVALSITSGISLRNIFAERAQAIAAREVAVINSAEAMLERDPTRAWAILEEASPIASPALLRARIKAAGVAERTIRLPGTFDGKAVVRGGQRVVIATGERTLHALNTESGTIVDLGAGLTEPAVWAATDEHVYFVRGTAQLSLAAVAIDGGAAVELTTLPSRPLYMRANANGAFWVSHEGTLHHVGVGSPETVVARDAWIFALVGPKVLTCSANGVLAVRELGRRTFELGTCTPEGAWATSSLGFAHFDGGELVLAIGDESRRIPVTKSGEMKYAQLTEAGLLTGIGPTGDALVLRRGGDVVERVRLSGRPEIVTAHGNIAGWAFSDGGVELFDTVDGRYWSLRAFDGMPRCFELLAGDRLITCGRREVRLWTLPRVAARIVTTLPAVTNNVVFDSSHNALFDGIDGNAYVVERGSALAVAAHAHDALSFGAAWCDSQACTSGWDGRVICTDVSTRTTRTVADLSSVTPWIAEGGGRCFTAAATGAVYDLRSPRQPLFRHKHEPYRLAVSPDGRYVVSGDWGGDIIVSMTRRSGGSRRMLNARTAAS